MKPNLELERRKLQRLEEKRRKTKLKRKLAKLLREKGKLPIVHPELMGLTGTLGENGKAHFSFPIETINSFLDRHKDDPVIE